MYGWQLIRSSNGEASASGGWEGGGVASIATTDGNSWGGPDVRRNSQGKGGEDGDGRLEIRSSGAPREAGTLITDMIYIEKVDRRIMLVVREIMDPA